MGSVVTRVMDFIPGSFQLATAFSILDLGSDTGQADRQTDRQTDRWMERQTMAINVLWGHGQQYDVIQSSSIVYNSQFSADLIQKDWEAADVVSEFHLWDSYTIDTWHCWREGRPACKTVLVSVVPDVSSLGSFRGTQTKLKLSLET